MCRVPLRKQMLVAFYQVFAVRYSVYGFSFSGPQQLIDELSGRPA